MKDKDVRDALGKKQTDEIDELLKDIDITDDDTIESLNKKQSARLNKVVKYFEKKLAETESNAVEKATADTRKKEDAKIQKFSEDNPGMKKQEVIDLMQPLYDKGKTLKEAYDVACKGLGLDPTTGEPPKEETAEEKTARETKEKEAKAKAKNSQRSTITDDPDADDDEGKGKKDDGPISIDDALKANSAAYIAKHGNPFDQKE
jgi:hypothetical protein